MAKRTPAYTPSLQQLCQLAKTIDTYGRTVDPTKRVHDAPRTRENPTVVPSRSKRGGEGWGLLPLTMWLEDHKLVTHPDWKARKENPHLLPLTAKGRKMFHSLKKTCSVAGLAGAKRRR